MMRWEFYSFVLLGLFSGHFLNARLVTISSCYGLATYILYGSAAAAAVDFHRPCGSMNDGGLCFNCCCWWIVQERTIRIRRHGPSGRYLTISTRPTSSSSSIIYFILIGSSRAEQQWAGSAQYNLRAAHHSFDQHNSSQADPKAFFPVCRCVASSCRLPKGVRMGIMHKSTGQEVSNEQ